MKKSYTNLILAISTIFFLFVLGVCIYFFNIIKNKNIHISAVSIALDKRVEDRDNINALKNKIVELNDTSKRINGYFVDTSAIDTFVEYLEGMGLSNNVNLSVKSVDVPKNEKNKIIVSLEMNGGFSDIMKVINILENAPYNIIINTSYLNKQMPEPSPLNNTSVNIKELPKVVRSDWSANVSFSILNL